MEIFDSAGRRIAIERELFRGGEGSIHPVAGNPDVLAKLYHSRIDAQKQAKLQAMTQSTQEPLLRVAAWPTQTLHGGRSGPMVGFLMPRFDGQRSELHQLFTPATRKQIFRKADWAFLLHAARNVAAAISTVHAAGHVVGDVNQRNFIVGQDATVKVLDCDSFQIRQGGRTFLCEVGMPEFTPPELQQRPLSGIERTPNHDAFGLAILCFQLLFMGRHPFAGRFLGTGEMPIERAIAEGRFAFGLMNRVRQMEPPPNMLTFESLPPRLATLFELAFGGGASRPSANDWIGTLDAVQAEIRACSVEPMHKFYGALPQCPWCRLETACGVYFFIGVLSSTVTTFDVSKLWSEIAALAGLPYEAPPRPAIPVTGAPVPDELAARRRRALAAKIVTVPAFVAAVVLFPDWTVAFIAVLIVILLFPMPGRRERKERRTRMEQAERAWLDAYARAEREVSIDPLRAKHAELLQAKGEYEAIPARKQTELVAMTQNARALQLERYLEQQLIRNHTIPDIGPKRKTTLSMWGIATAADVTPQALLHIQGFGPTLKTRLLSWRMSVEAKFTFDAKRAIPQQDLQALEYRWQRRQLDLEQRLRTGAEQVRRLNAEIRKRRQTVAKELEQPARDWAQARADVEALELALKGRP